MGLDRPGLPTIGGNLLAFKLFHSSVILIPISLYFILKRLSSDPLALVYSVIEIILSENREIQKMS